MNTTLPTDLCGIITTYSTPIYVCDYDKSIKLLQDICQTNKYDNENYIHYSSSGAAYKIYEIWERSSDEQAIDNLIHNIMTHNYRYITFIELKKITHRNEIMEISGIYYSHCLENSYQYCYNSKHNCWIYEGELHHAYGVLIIEKIK